MFKLLAIRPLEGCAPHIQKCLKTGMMYYFCNDYIIEPGSHIRRRSKNIKPLKEDFFTVVSESDYSEDNSSERKSPTVSVSAIVGMNGDGKSTLVELMMRLINNCAISYELCALSDNSKGENGNKTEPHYNLRRVENAKAELYYMIDNMVYRMAEEKDQKETRIWKVSELNPFNEKGEELMRWEIDSVEIQKVEDDPKGFFFTIVSNYSHYAYNIYDYEKEWEIRGGEKDDDEKCWLHYVFHKNDGYLTPITLHPFRKEGNIDINTEKSLSSQRLLSLFLKADNPNDNPNSFRRVNGKDANVLKLEEVNESKLQKKAIIDFFKATNQENKFNWLIKMIDRAYNTVDQSVLLFYSNHNKVSSFIKDYENLSNTIMESFANPIKQIVKQDSVFGDYINEIGSWIQNNDIGVLQNTSDLGAVILQYGKLFEKTNQYIEAIISNNKGLKSKHWNDAIDCFTRALKLNPNFAEAYNNRGIVYYNTGVYDKAIENYDKAISLNPNDSNVYYNRGNVYAAKGEYDKAISEYGKVIELNSNDTDAYYRRGIAYAIKGEYDKAIYEYNKAIELNSIFAEAYYNRAYACYKTEAFNRAIEDYSKTITLNSEYQAKAYFNMGNAYYKMGDYDNAILHYNNAISTNSIDESAYVFNNRGNAYFHKGEYEMAMRNYETARRYANMYDMATRDNETARSCAEIFFNVGNIYAIKGEYEKAVFEYNNAIKLNPDFIEAYYNRGNAYFKMNDYHSAIWDYGKALNLNPKDSETYFNLGNSYFNEEKYESAIYEYNIAISLDPKDADKYLKRGAAYIRINDYDNANKDFNMFKELNPSYANGNDGIDNVIILDCRESKSMINSKSIRLLTVNNNQRDENLSNEDMKKILQFQKYFEEKMNFPLQLKKEYEIINSINAIQLGRLDTLYRIMKFYGIDWKIVTEDYALSSLEKKCQHYIVYKVLSVLSKYPNYREAFTKDSNESLRECGPKLDDCIKKLKEDYSHITLKLRQVENFMSKGFHKNGLYVRLKKSSGPLLVEIDKLKQQYESNTISLDNLPPPIYKWDILFQKKEDPNCVIEFDSFSSGEKQLLYSISAIIYHLQNLANTSSEVKYNNVNLIMEEIELYYHPEYQRKFFSRLLDLIKRAELGNIQNISIVFVTHSPFILSDIPKSNVLFLKEGMPKDIMQENTFGANIHTLLKNGFFMPNLPIGEFAYGKINKLFGKLNSGELDPDNDLDEIYQEILLVGEPFLRNQLLMLYNSYKGSRVMPVNTNKERN